ncbi:hypothetical protein D3C87_2158100 [compost metagenome]
MTLVIRIMGMRSQPSARMVALDWRPILVAVSRELKKPRKTPFSMIGARCAGIPSSS